MGCGLDAIPYLVEREGTNCENLPETHAVLKRIRAEMDAHFPDRMLLAEANQWPEDTYPYFGDGDECHMAFHFPLMPRMYMAIAQEDRHAITDIMRQTPEIPDSCQWAIFLRNHDELTLEMVTQNEREYLWNTYAADRRMRINLGIRRRLAPLLDNDRRTIELMNALLMSMPGTPVIYYGDEIGMGDNIYLGDRDGVRTPMQWSPDRNGGFSRANPQALYAPPIQDPIFGYQAVNVEAQQQSPGSLLNWMKRLIAVRQGRQTFGRGTLRPSSTRATARSWPICASYEGETILCVYNLSRNAQACDLELAGYRDRVPVELLGRTDFPPISDPGYRLTLPGYGFYWLVLAEAGQLGSWHQPATEPLPDFITIVLHDSWRAISESRGGRELARQVLPEYLPKQSWFAPRDQPVESVRLGTRRRVARSRRATTCWPSWRSCSTGCPERNAASCRSRSPGARRTWRRARPLLPYTLAKARRGANVGALYDATHADDFARTLLQLMHEEARADDRGLAAALPRRRAPGRAGDRRPKRPSAASATSRATARCVVDERVLLKIYRRLEAGPPSRSSSSGRFLTDVVGFRARAAAAGLDRACRRGRHAHGAGRSLRLRPQPGRRLAFDAGPSRPRARGAAPYA